MLTEKLSFIDALYFTIVTISTVGYGDISPVTLPGRILAIALVVIGVALFLGIVAEATQLLVQRKQEKLRRQRIQILMGLFFSELGNQLLKLCVEFDVDQKRLIQVLSLDGTADDNFKNIKAELVRHPFKIDVKKMDVEKVKELLGDKGGLVMRLLENPSLHEHELFTELLRTIFHLREELLARQAVDALPGSDIQHLGGDMERIYPILTIHWLNYLQYLKSNYSYLYSLAVRTNPFNPPGSPVVEKN
jgi:hypothetical protein